MRRLPPQDGLERGGLITGAHEYGRPTRLLHGAEPDLKFQHARLAFDTRAAI